MSNIVFTGFENPKLNELASVMISRTKRAMDHYREAEKSISYAIQDRWLNGRDFVENEAEILAEVKYQKVFAEKIGVTEQMLSNDVRAYRALKEEGVHELEQLIPHLKKKNINPIVSNWERLPRMLNDPVGTMKDQRPRDERRLETLYAEIEEIKSRNLSENNNYVAEEAVDLQNLINDLRERIDVLNPERYVWVSEKYKQWCRDLGICMITKNPCHPEFHHTNLRGGSGGMGTKLPDVFGFPVDPVLHSQIENGQYEISPMEIADALVTTMALFIMNTYE